MTFERFAMPVEQTPAELAVTVGTHADGLRVTFDYAAELFTADAMAAVLDRFLDLLERVAADPEQRLLPRPHVPLETDASSRPALASVPWPRPVVVSPRPALVPLLTGDGAERRPVYLVPGGSGSANMLFAMAGQIRQWRLGRPVCGFLATEPIATDDGHAWIEATAAAYAAELRARQPDGPYLLVGSCIGGGPMVATALHLSETGLAPPHVILIDARHPALGRLPPAQVWRDLTPPPVVPRRALYVGNAVAEAAPMGEGADPADDPTRYFERVLYGPRYVRMKQHRLRPYPGEVTLLANQVWLEQVPALGWAPPAVARLTVHTLPGDHEGHMQDNPDLIGRIVRPLLDEIEGAASVFPPAGGDTLASPPHR